MKQERGPGMRTILLSSLTGTVVLVLLCASLLFIRTYQNSLVNTAQTSGQRTVSQVCETVDAYLGDIRSMMEILEQSLEDDSLDREDFFDAFFRIRPEVIAVSTYDEEGELLRCYSLDHEVRDTIRNNLSFDDANTVVYQDGYISAPHVVSLFEGYYPWAVTVVVPFAAGEEERWVALDISCGNISSYISGTGIGQRGYCFLIDTDGNLVYHPQQQLIYASLKEEDIPFIAALPDGSYRKDRMIYTVQTLENGNWRTVGVSFLQEVITASLRQFVRILMIVSFIILIAMFVIAAILSTVLSRPLQSLADAMQRFEESTGDFTYEDVGGAREVRTLSRSFGHMAVRIQKLLDTVREEEKNLRKTELKALQAQINPHFLYNTLDSISWLCEQGRNQDAVHMVNALAKLFRISISRGHELIPIRSELQHAESYLRIQSFRYRGQFVYTFDVDESCLDYLCNKITLQPIIENALNHGLNGLVDDGEIRISVKEEGRDIRMTVADNGIGMSKEQIEGILNREQSDQAGIGIKNVNDRLQIYFGEAYGISIDSQPDEGTRVHILMPKVTEEAEYEKK